MELGFKNFGGGVTKMLLAYGDNFFWKKHKMTLFELQNKSSFIVLNKSSYVLCEISHLIMYYVKSITKVMFHFLIFLFHGICHQYQLDFV